MEKGVFKLGGVTVYSVLAQFNAYNVKSIEAVLAAWMIVCAGEAVVAKFAGASGRMGKALVNALKKNVEYKVIGTDRDVDSTSPGMPCVQRSLRTRIRRWIGRRLHKVNNSQMA